MQRKDEKYIFLNSNVVTDFCLVLFESGKHGELRSQVLKVRKLPYFLQLKRKLLFITGLTLKKINKYIYDLRSI